MATGHITHSPSLTRVVTGSGACPLCSFLQGGSGLFVIPVTFLLDGQGGAWTRVKSCWSLSFVYVIP